MSGRDDEADTSRLEEALLAAVRPGELDPAALDGAIAAALGFALPDNGIETVEDEASSPEEQLAARRLSLALDGWALQGPPVALARSLQAAWNPTPLTGSRTRELVDAALEEVGPDVGVTVSEQKEARRLAEALDGARATHPLLPLAEALAHAAGRPSPVRRRRTAVWLLAGTATAAAAALALVAGLSRPPAEDAELRAARSTDELFDERFEPGRTSSRVDRIAAERERDLRHNRFAQWGVR